MDIRRPPTPSSVHKTEKGRGGCAFWSANAPYSIPALHAELAALRNFIPATEKAGWNMHILAPRGPLQKRILGRIVYVTLCGFDMYMSHHGFTHGENLKGKEEKD
jgi:hypothetical protein